MGPLGPSVLVDGPALSRLFSRTQPAATTAAAAKRSAKRAEVQQVTLISSKRAQNVAIVLARLSMPTQVRGFCCCRRFVRALAVAAAAAKVSHTLALDCQKAPSVHAAVLRGCAVTLGGVGCCGSQEAANRLQCLDSSGFSVELLERLEQVCPLPEELESFEAYIEQQQRQQEGAAAAAAVGEAAAAAASAGPPLRDIEAAMLPFVKVSAVPLRMRIIRFELLAPRTLKELEDALDLVDRAAEQVGLIAVAVAVASSSLAALGFSQGAASAAAS